MPEPPEVTKPEPAHHKAAAQDAPEEEETQQEDTRREATELRNYGQSSEISSRKTKFSRRQTAGQDANGWKRRVKLFWKRHISIEVAHENCRDHLANERTYLGYLRTSLALSFTAVTIAQLFRLENDSKTASPTFGFYAVGMPLAAIFTAASMAVILLGFWRFWRQQNAMQRGKVHAGGWEVYSVMVVAATMVILLFIVVLGIDAYMDQHGEV